MDRGLLKWAVYRTLDTAALSSYDMKGETADQRLARWRQSSASDEQILRELKGIYEYNPALRSAGEPVVVATAAYAPAGQATVPALWCSFDNADPNLRFNPQTDDWEETPPSAVGGDLVAVVRELLTADQAPAVPKRTMH